MDSVTTCIYQKKGIASRLFPAVGPMFLISMGYIDPGKWASAIEGGAHFGSDLILLMFVFNSSAILCQYLAVHIGLVTGKNLAQICSEEYNKSICILLGVQAELSVIALDLTMILGVAHALNLLFGVDLFICIFLTALDAVLFPLFTTFLEKFKVEVPFSIMAAVIFLSYILGILINQPEIPLGINGMLTRLNGESAFTLMSLLGAAIMPHNFYLHSSIVQLQQQHGPPYVSKGALCHDHFFAILCIFSGIFLVNSVLMNSAATVFHSAGLVVLTLQDALLLMDQVFRSPMATFAFFLVLLISSQITTLTWNIGGQVVLNNLFAVDLPAWIHRATIRMIAIVPALYCAWNSGAEGVYRLLIFAQVVVAMLLPPSVIPLFRVASSSSIMGAFRISQLLEFLALAAFIGILGLEFVFFVEVLFGESDWVGSLRWNMGSSVALPYVVVLIIASTSLCMMLWLATTPLKSASINQDAQTWNWDIQNTLPKLSMEGEEFGLVRTSYHGEGTAAEEPACEKSLESCSDGLAAEFDVDLPETIMDSDQEAPATLSEEKHTTATTEAPSSPKHQSEESVSTTESVPVANLGNEVSDNGSLDSDSVQKTEPVDPVGKTGGVKGDLQTDKDDDEGETWAPEESSRSVSAGAPTSTSEGSGSFRSLGGKTDEGTSGGGSLSRFSGLGRAARRQLAAILDEFWGQLYDFHGQITQEAKSKKLDVLLGVDPNPSVSQKIDPTGNQSSGFFPLVAESGSDFLINSSIYDSPKKQQMPSNVGLSYGLQTGSSASWSTRMHLLDAYAESSSCSVADASERRYSSLRLPQSSDGWDYQPATVHGYQMASYLAKMALDRNADALSTSLDPLTPKTSSFVPTNYRDSTTYALGQKLQDGITSLNSSTMHNPMASRNSSLQAESPYYDSCSYGPVENPGSTKKYHSLPDISGLAVPLRDSYLSDRSAQWGTPIGKTAYEQSLYSNTGSRAEVPLPFDELSPSKLYREALSVQLTPNSDTSLWSRQPSEQLFGVAGRTQCVGDGTGTRQNLVMREMPSQVDLEAKLLQSFRCCVAKLLKLEGSDWLFRQNDGADEDLIGRVATRESCFYEAESREVNQIVYMGESQYLSIDKKISPGLKNEDASLSRFLVSLVPHCGEGCVWRVDLIVSFGVWCIHRILELSLMESRPELWGKYTYVLNRLQGVLDMAFSKPRTPLPPCFCLQVLAAHARRSSPPLCNAPSGRPGRGKCTSASMLLDLIRDVETAVSCRKGRTGTAAGDVAFPKGKENLASVLKRYKRRLSNKPVGAVEGGSASRKVPILASYAS